MVVGTFSLLFAQHLSHNGARSLVIEDMVVETQCREQGIGRAMMEFAIARAREKNCYKISLSSNTRRSEAHEFYEKLGFRRHGISFYMPVED